MRRRAETSRRGFTIVEALAAGVILTMSAMVVGSAVNRAMFSLRLAADTQRAAQLLDGTLTKIDMVGPDRLLTEGPMEGGFSGEDGRFRWEAEIESRLEGHLYDVTVRISWMTDAGRRSVEAATRLNDPPNSRNAAVRWEDL
jgi:hypothetical protein